MWIGLALLSGVSAALLAVVVKLHLKDINPYFIFLLFSLITIVVLLAVDLATNKVDSKMVALLTLKDWTALLIAGALNTFAFVCYLSALKYGPTGAVLAIDRMGIVFALVLGAMFLNEALTVQAIIGGLMMVLGAFLIGA